MKKITLLAFALITLGAFTILRKEKPTLYLIGDSTVAEGSGTNGLWGWGKFLPMFFDTAKLPIYNYAVGGTSTRTFQTNGIWDKSLNKKGMWDTVYSKLKKGDYLMIQFGLNDQSPVDDTTRSRGTLQGIGEDSLIILNKVTNEVETVHTFGWYLRRFIAQAKSKGATIIVCSSIPRNSWKDGKLKRGENGFAEWALQVAQQENVFSIDLNNRIADVYDQEGMVAVTTKYHSAKDNTHTVQAGSILNASMVVDGIKALDNCKLKKYLIK